MTDAVPKPESATASWPGSLMERVVRVFAADFRRPVGPIDVAVILAVAAVLESRQSAGPFDRPMALALGLAATAPIAVLRRWPAQAIAVVLAASAGFVMFGRLSWSVAAVTGWLIALAACPLLLPRSTAVAAAALTEVAVLIGPAGLNGNVTPWDATVAEALAVIAAWGAGELLRARRQAAAERAAIDERVRYLSEQQVAARERASIARELHDVVAHHVSMIAVRAATAPYTVPELPPTGQAAFAEIADEARTALTELRVVLGVLRSPEGTGSPQAAPQPTIADLDSLVCRFTSAGADAELAVTGEVRPLPSAVELCCYRVVQEALTNAGRHAPGGHVRVAVAYGPQALRVEVSDEGAALPQRRAAAGGPGFGLTGLRERVSILGGQFRAGPAASRGFCVLATIPLPEAS